MSTNKVPAVRKLVSLVTLGI